MDLIGLHPARLGNLMTPFTPTTPAALSPTAATVAASLLDDTAYVLHDLGLKAIRAAVVDLGSMDILHVWAMSDDGACGESGVPAADMPFDSQFPDARTHVQHLGLAAPDAAVEQRLSPHHWSFVWRLDGERAMVAEARYHDARAIVGTIDIALVRLLCDVGVFAGLPSPVVADEENQQILPTSGRLPARNRSIRLSRLAVIALTGVGTLLAVWMALSGVAHG